ncbi:hypothetical protein KSMBR1_2113 [Candidatus Kuenenia stuttgartiensis]|jgi:hypothetical protein|nr:hypothetical protein KSMBR1_2113 [Candidatus Kuenenia stuttgartiensis]
MKNQKSNKRYNAILFDIVGTLLTRQSADFQVFAGRCQETGITIDLDTARRGWKQSERWIF